VEALYDFPAWQSKAVFEMAQALDRLGAKDQAKAQYQRLIQKYPDTEAAKAAKAKLN
jgi:TolA-binding protein